MRPKVVICTKAYREASGMRNCGTEVQKQKYSCENDSLLLVFSAKGLLFSNYLRVGLQQALALQYDIVIM